MFHLLKDLQHHRVGGFSLAISLRIVWCRSSMLDEICFSQVLHVFVYERGPIVTDKSLGDPKPCNDVFSNEVYYSCSSGFFQRDSFYPFCKVLGGYQDPYITIGKRVYRPYKIKPASVERSRCCHILQHIWMSEDCISKYLACMTQFN